ncbi:MAG TPA: VOC family protein [Spirochaetia bacterium]|nr:VOC family protein [Spirochaetia bacterium]
MKMDPVVHFELPARDKGRMSRFYAGVFGWKTQQLGPEMGNYVVVQTTETGENNFPKEPGRINGGFYERTKDDQAPSVVIAVDDIRDAMKRVAAAGGKVLGGQKPGEPDDIPGIGLFVAFVDTEGNRVSMLQPRGMP